MRVDDHATMPALPFDPVQLAPALPDVIAAIALAFVLAVVTFRPPKAPSMPEAPAAMAQVQDVDPEDDGS